jgi:hypothetical protein
LVQHAFPPECGSDRGTPRSVRPDQYFSGTKFRSFSAARSSYLGHGPKDATAHTFGQRLDGAALAGGIPSLENDDDASAGLLDPILQMPCSISSRNQCRT